MKKPLTRYQRLPLIQQRILWSFPTYATLAREFEMSQREVQEDVHVMFDTLGLPIRLTVWGSLYYEYHPQINSDVFDLADNLIDYVDAA